MKKIVLVLLVSVCISYTFQNASAQTFDSPGAYITFMGQQYKEIQKDMLSYTSAVGHGKSARKVENKRKEIIQTNRTARKKIAALAPYDGDKSLRDSSVSFLDMSYHVLNDDYGKIVNLEEVAEQSYDAMEAYMLAQDLAHEKLEKAGDMLSLTEKSFAATHKVTLIEGDDEVSKKMKIASSVNNYHRNVYLIFFKSYKQEMYLMDAIAKKDVSAIEQNKNTLLTYAKEGQSKLDTMKAYNGDKTLINSCKQMLEFYKNECSKVPSITNYYLKEESFQKVKKAFEAKSESQRKQEDVDQYNKAIAEMNQGVNEYNTTNNTLNNGRKTNIDNWNKTAATFLDKYTPKYK
jgi:hypothetical protein